MTNNVLNQSSSDSRRIAGKIRFQLRWLLIGLLVPILIYIGYFFNYHLVYAGIAEEIFIQSDDIQLAGILVKPDTPGPYPAIVLLHHAGPQRYEKWFYRIHTNVFVRQGFAVLSYDQRGSGNSEGELRTAGFPEFVNDGSAIVNFLQAQSDIIPDQIGLFGASESGWYSPEIAAKSGNIAFIINKVGPPMPWLDTVLHEARMDALAAGVQAKDIEDVLSLKTRIYQFYVDTAFNEGVDDGSEREEINALLTEINNRPGVENVMIKSLPEYEAIYYKALASKASYDPSPFLREIDIPMLYILAGEDVNIPFESSVDHLERLKFELNKDITIQMYPTAGHYLYRYNWFPMEGFYVHGYLDLIGNWASSRIDRDNQLSIE